MKVIGKIVKFILILGVVLFALSLVVYFFNLDMKVASLMEPVMKKHYDKMPRDKRL